MLDTILSSLALRRSMVQIFPASLQNFWQNWELRFLVLFSLTIQSILFCLGKKRKFYTRIWLRITIWFAYLLADWIATMSLGVLSQKEGEHKDADFVEPKYVIVALWAPLLLFHLGGPDTLTAYSMEDNALWTRRFLSYSVQVAVAIYIFLRSWTSTDLNILAIPIFIAGIIKTGERIWVLWSASSQKFKESLFPDPDPGPNYARYMEAYKSASFEGYEVDVHGLIETPSAGVDHSTHAAAGAQAGNIIPLPQTDTYGQAITITTAHKFLNISKLLFADLILSFEDVSESRLSLLNGNGKDGFEVIEVELGFMYDLFYTKAPVIYSYTGAFLRSVTLSCSIGVLCVYLVMDKNQYPKVDLFITGVLLLGAIILEIWSVISMLSSDWTILWMSKHKTGLSRKAISFIQAVRNKRWSRSIGQFNLIKFCLNKARKRRHIKSTLGNILSIKVGLNKYIKAFHKKASKFGLGPMIIGAWQSYHKYKHTNSQPVNDDLKKIIFEQLKNKILGVVKFRSEEELATEIKTFCDHRGDNVLRNLKSNLLEKIKDEKKVEKEIKKISWSVEVAFDQSILLWHIATNLCYNSAIGDEHMEHGRISYKNASKWLSEYMLYLLVMRPSMLPNGIGEIRFQDTSAEATEFVKDRHSIKEENEVCDKLLRLSSEIEKVSPAKVKGDRSKSVLFDACKLAKHIQELRSDEEWETKDMWIWITRVWVEMLAYAASHCQVIHHAQELRHGGELLTHVWLLMAHLGITDRLQISKGFGRAKLIRR